MIDEHLMKPGDIIEMLLRKQMAAFRQGPSLEQAHANLMERLKNVLGLQDTPRLERFETTMSGVKNITCSLGNRLFHVCMDNAGVVVDYYDEAR